MIKSIKESLSLHDYHHTHSMPDIINYNEEQKIEFVSCWDNLEFDENFKHYTNRRRRILRYFYNQYNKSELTINLDNKYHPYASYDIEYTEGCNTIKYANSLFINNAITNKLLLTDIKVIKNFIKKDSTYSIDIHLFRVQAENGEISPTTSGIHQDGVDWICMHFINMHNIKDVESEVFTSPSNDSMLFSKKMDTFLETIFVNDKKLFHRAGNIQQIDKRYKGYRNLLLVSFKEIKRSNKKC